MERKCLQACMEGISSVFSGLFCHKFSIQVCIHRITAKVCYNIKNNIKINISTHTKRSLKACIWIIGDFCLKLVQLKSYTNAQDTDVNYNL